MADEEFRAFAEARYAKLLRTAYLLVGSADQEEDVLQSALLATMTCWRHVDDGEPATR